jgi:AraC-like DNA-binding protein
LVDTHDSAAIIARDLGYSSPAYFTRAFGQETGTTPTGYRDQKQGQWHSTRHRQPLFHLAMQRLNDSAGGNFSLGLTAFFDNYSVAL